MYTSGLLATNLYFMVASCYDNFSGHFYIQEKMFQMFKILFLNILHRSMFSMEEQQSR
jgi:hypothetical protein